MTGIFARRAVAMLALLTGALLSPSTGSSETLKCGDRPLLVFAAASLTDVIEAAAAAFTAATECPVAISVAGSSVLARQIEAGAPATLFLSANSEWVTWLETNAAERISGPPRVLARNRLVVVGRADPAEIADLLSTRFAMADPAHVPAGMYAKTALEALGVWTDVASNAIFTENVRLALSLAERGDVSTAIVYATDARMEPGLNVLYRFDDANYPEIRYEAVLLTGAGETGGAFLDMLAGPEGQEILAKYGFLAPDGTP
ncbi:molybdate ABC transporter substrate-binding protein [Oricola cellulosilytica]|uniref:Molybdate ABC transporter substrate-binding protein n=1 Tax=Oricola cellulosilytica TaxID=1429082 RepID=A0A4R0P3F5_9HYPH|nr:molybdate ABC transporter substrate-binding protein [Oricola cellulosilytica]TCD11380.1 molybdate ABC transporter substrate-binding protein [Oricola cellulosilytica]